MYIVIAMLGIAILAWSYLKNRRLNKVLSGQSPQRPVLLQSSMSNIINEWKQYSAKNYGVLNGYMVSLGLVFFSLTINSYWLQFPFLFFLPTICAALFIGQIRLGRSLHRKVFDEKFPEVLGVVNSAVAAGSSINQALARCGENVEGEMGSLFNMINRRLNLGEDPERVFIDAWRAFCFRDFYFFFVVMLVSMQRGGQLRLLINRLSRIINVNKTLERRKKAMTSEARASAKIVAAIPILFFIGMKYLSPENFNFIMTDGTGRIILYYVIASEVIGIMIINLLVRRAT